MIPNRAYVVQSLPRPWFGTSDTKWGEVLARSIHLDPVEAKVEAQRLRKEVFTRLSRDGEEPEEYIARHLTYRQSIKVTVYGLDKIATASVE